MLQWARFTLAAQRELFRRRKWKRLAIGGLIRKQGLSHSLHENLCTYAIELAVLNKQFQSAKPEFECFDQFVITKFIQNLLIEIINSFGVIDKTYIIKQP